MARVEDIAKYVRSKNAGPFWVTIEIFCDTDEAYKRITGSPNLRGEKVAELYGADSSLIKVFEIENLRVKKYSFPRPLPSGHKYENDMHYGQQYIRLAEIEV
ncbi:MAG: DUF4387 domain-containing protein [Treponema sp.]|jgi:hypothetical protein|nr:DUF4387 domain-containing protein [Treponema sp.]